MCVRRTITICLSSYGYNKAYDAGDSAKQTVFNQIVTDKLGGTQPHITRMTQNPEQETKDLNKQGVVMNETETGA